MRFSLYQFLHRASVIAFRCLQFPVRKVVESLGNLMNLPGLNWDICNNPGRLYCPASRIGRVHPACQLRNKTSVGFVPLCPLVSLLLSASAKLVRMVSAMVVV